MECKNYSYIYNYSILGFPNPLHRDKIPKNVTAQILIPLPVYPCIFRLSLSRHCSFAYFTSFTGPVFSIPFHFSLFNLDLDRDSFCLSQTPFHCVHLMVISHFHSPLSHPVSISVSLTRSLMVLFY